MMKALLKLIFLCYCLFLFNSCEKEIMGYEGKEGVYFSIRHDDGAGGLRDRWPYQPFTNLNFSRLGVQEIDLSLQVMITGPAKDYDRVFRLIVNPDSTTAIEGIHYEVIDTEWIVPANALGTMINVRLKNTPDLATDTVSIGLQLVATEDFELSFPEFDAIPTFNAGKVVSKFDASQHALHISDVMVKPLVWIGNVDSQQQEFGELGFFTREKMVFLEEYLGLQYSDFLSRETMSSGRIISISNQAAQELIRLYNEGNPRLEKDGRLMFIGPVPWTSTIGVPWVSGE